MAGGIRRMDDLYCIGGKGKTKFYFRVRYRCARSVLPAIIGSKGHFGAGFLGVKCSI